MELPSEAGCRDRANRVTVLPGIEPIECPAPRLMAGKLVVHRLHSFVPPDLFREATRREGAVGKLLLRYPHALRKAVDYAWAEGPRQAIEKLRSRVTLDRSDTGRGVASVVALVAERDGPGPPPGTPVLAWSLQGPVDADWLLLSPEQCLELPFPHPDFALAPYLAWLLGTLEGLEGGVRACRLETSSAGLAEHFRALFSPAAGGRLSVAASFGAGTPAAAADEIPLRLTSERGSGALVSRAGTVWSARLPDASRFFLDPLYPGEPEFPAPFERERVAAVVASLSRRLDRLEEALPRVVPAPVRTVVLKSESEGPPALRVSMLGAGMFARALLLHNLRRRTRVGIRGVMDVRPEIAAALARAIGAAFATTEPEAIFGDERTDLVLVVSDHASHADYASAAIEAGKMVHIEKPPAVEPESLRRLLDTIRRRPGAVVTVGYNRPHAPAFRLLAERLAPIPGPTHVSCIVKGHRLGRAHWYRWPNQGTRIAGNLVHWIDLGYRLTGRARPLWAEVASSPRDSLDVEAASLDVTFDDGSLLTIAFSSAGDETFGVQEIVDVKRGDLSALVRNFETIEIVQGGKRVRRAFGRDKGHAGVFRDLAERALSRTGDPLVVEDMAATSAILFAAQTSMARGGGRVEIRFGLHG